MTFIKTIPKEEAQSPLKELYQEIEVTFGIKKVPNAFISSSIDPEITRWVWQGAKTIMFRDSSIDMPLKETIALYTIFLGFITKFPNNNQITTKLKQKKMDTQTLEVYQRPYQFLIL